MSLMTCPDCHGSCITIASHVHYADGSSGWNVPMKCFRCDGSGTVPDVMHEWIVRGRAMRDRRVNGTPYRSQREEAARRGISVVELSRMEMGKIEPKESEE